jgi:hypothetical protein
MDRITRALLRDFSHEVRLYSMPVSLCALLTDKIRSQELLEIVLVDD